MCSYGNNIKQPNDLLCYTCYMLLICNKIINKVIINCFTKYSIVQSLFVVLPSLKCSRSCSGGMGLRFVTAEKKNAAERLTDMYSEGLLL